MGDAELGKLQQLEHAVVRRIASKAKISSELVKRMESAVTPNRLTFNELVMVTDFPLRLKAIAMKRQELYRLDYGMNKHPTKTQLYAEWEEFRDNSPPDCEGMLGVVFNWKGHGRGLIFHDAAVGELGSRGQYWRIDGKLFFLEPADSIVARIGTVDAW